MIGGGLQGCAVALELAERGVDVDLFEGSARIMQGASRHSEGKIHLGFVYAADETLRTARLMAAGAAVFMPSLQRWLGSVANELATSSPFRYGVHRASLRTPDELEPVYRSIADDVRREFGEHRQSAGVEPSHLRRLEPGDDWPYGDSIVRVYETGEIAVDPMALADAIERAVLDRPGITTSCETQVHSIDARQRLLRLQDRDGRCWTSEPYDHVVNCSWAGLPKLDATAGLLPARPWSFRMKYFVRLPAARAPIPTPSTTFVLGPFGDVADFGANGRYLSWYPAGRLGFSTDIEPPRWSTELSSTDSATLAGHIVDGLSTVMPSLAAMRESVIADGAVRGGVIFAHGATDLSDDETDLHQRHTIGVTSAAGYHSVNTGKLTTAPLFARRVATRLCSTA